MENPAERINEREIICIICPNSCRLNVWRDLEGEIHIKGNQCKRGIKYGQDEYTHPVRMVITTMRIKGARSPVIPVRSSKPIPKEKIFEAIKIVNDHKCQAPVEMGQVLIKNLLGEDVDIIASRTVLVSIPRSAECVEYNAENPNEVIDNILNNIFFNGTAELSPVERVKIDSARNLILKKLRKFDLTE